MPKKDVQVPNSKRLMDNPLVKRIIYQLPHGREGYQVAQVIAGKMDKHPELVTKAKVTARHILEDFKNRQKKDPRATFVIEGLEELLTLVDETPKVGDLVMMTPGASEAYNHTQEGSYGILKRLVGDVADIEFYRVTGLKGGGDGLMTGRVDRKYFKKAVLETEIEQIRTTQANTPRTLGLNDKVQIREDSVYYGQHDGEGRITIVDPFNKERPFIVTFRDGGQNNYSIEDLEIVKTTKEKTPRTEVKFGAKKHDETCVHQGLAGRVCHYISRVSADHIVGSIITAVAIYVGQWAAEQYHLKERVADLFRQETKTAQTMLYEPNKPVIEPTMTVSGRVPYTTKMEVTADPKQEAPQMPDAETMKRVMKLY